MGVQVLSTSQQTNLWFAEGPNNNGLSLYSTPFEHLTVMNSQE